MWFWMLAGALAAAAALVVAGRAASATRRAAEAGADPALEVHARQLAELDDLARRGLLGDAELGAAKAEAGRRLLAAADHAPAPERVSGRPSRLAVTAGAAGSAVLALGLYVALGRPGAPGAPYTPRVKAWSQRDPATLQPAELAAVLKSLAPERPHEVQLFEFLGRAELAAGDAGEAATAFARAARLAPTNAEYPAAAGEALMSAGQNKVTPEAEAQFREALRRDPKNAAARFHLGQLAITQGDTAGGLAQWRGLLADLPAADARRAELQSEIADAEGGPAPALGAPPGAPSAAQVAAAAGGAPAAGPEQAAFIRGMVDRLAQRLAAKPDDVDGWARLVRAYRVLGDGRAEADALTRARTVFARRPDDLRRIETEAKPSP